ncbi:MULTISPECIES: ATP-binding protein [unclassified Streptomyces]|uniref:ATP-binding protein n=1 Tax=Streptomyces evansiae TaxID=3075535 RepID=A0ABU2R6F5_9ACTN|nr:MULTISPECIES: ATP-binding protein [unclassified Streptomyces]MDT0411967.1 ATP-binding protein [Streptomyces sp. DSM 41979]MYQ58950.1 ATP-binding protein [Streptomyces sp. SID4926]SCE58473.1 Anti-sigma regulatory factor (Ser/Thr protein kinase) [Streptomyces sp. DfronAA-171]
MSHAQESTSPPPRRRPSRIEVATVGQPSYSERLPRTPEAVGQARRLVTLVLAVWGLSQLTDDAALLVSELATNAVLHARGDEIRVSVDRLSAARVRVSVADESGEAAPRREAGGAYDESGRGLFLVGALARAAGTAVTPLGKRVWAELEAGSGRDSGGQCLRP